MSNNKSVRRQILYSGILFAVIAVLFGLWSHYNTHDHTNTKELVLKNGTAFPVPHKVDSFELKNAPDGHSFTNDQLQGHWTMMFFGFTHCAMLCPTTLATLNKFYSDLDSNKTKQLQIVFVSIDPERDSLQRIHQYVTSFNKNFKGATADDDKLDRMTNQFNILYVKNNPNKDENYQIDHSGTVLLFDPKGNLAALFSPPIDAKELQQDYLVIVKKAKTE